jgi:serpin B
MHLEPQPHRYAVGADREVVELLYGNGAFAMTIVLPGQGRTLEQLAEGLDAARWSEWTGSLQEMQLGLALPKFRLEYTRELEDDLSALGMRLAFDADHADFSRMADPAEGRLFLTRATQKTFVDVNEEGTEAAAVTSIGVGVTSAPQTVVIDRPFLFVIRERLSGTIFFIGQVNRIP